MELAPRHEPARRLVRAAGVRAGEGRIVSLVALLFVALEAGRGFGEVGVDTLVVSRFGAETLPFLFIGLGATSLLAALGYGAALGRISRTHLLVGVLVGAALLLVAGCLIMAGGIEGVIPFVWLVTYAAGAIAGTIAWTVAGSVFDARQAKRLFPLCTGAAIAGSFVGTLGSGPLARIAGTELLVLVEAVLLVGVAVVIVAIARTGRVRVPARRRDRSVVADLRLGLDEVVGSPLFRLVAVAYVLFSVLYFSVTYPFFQAASAAFPAEADLATTIGLLSAAVTATSFLVSLTVANRVYARFGVGGAALALPIVYLLGFGLWLVQFSFATAALVRFTQQVTQRGLSNAAWSAFYNVIPSERRAQVLAFVDGVPGQLGMIISGLLLLGAGRLFAADQVFWLGAIAAITLTIVVLAIRRRYGGSLIRTLRSGLGEQVLEGGPGLAALARDPQLGSALTAALHAPEAVVRRMAVSLLGRTGVSGAAEGLVAAVEDVDAGVRVAAIGGLAVLPRGTAPSGSIIDRLTDPDDTVRAAAVRAIGQLELDGIAGILEPLADDPSVLVRAAVVVALDGTTGAADGVTRLLADPSPEVRSAVIEEVAAVGGLRRGETIAHLLLRALDDDSPRVRRLAAGLLAKRDAETPGVVDLLTAGSPRSQDAAIMALLGHGPAVRTAVLAWAETQIQLATTWRGSRLALETDNGSTPAPDTAVAFLASVLARREAQLADRALSGLAVLGAAEAGGVIRRCIRSSDQETRAQALEALDSIGDRRLSRAVVAFLDADAGGPSTSRDIVLHDLAGNDDPWVAALARRALNDWEGTGAMAETARTINEIDTMLLLRRVPLFQGLDPEDLQRIAGTCSEHVFPAGEALVREGEIGSELFVIVEGTVEVVRGEPDGTTRRIRGYDAGDHIGELAVLRDRPRAASVIAEGHGVRALMIDGENLKAILRERPEAAMAMLATLAERISAQ
jgi:HEAT repeat protein/ATP/ADP translocase